MKFNRLRRLGALALALVLALSLAVTPAWADDPDATPDPNTPVSVALESLTLTVGDPATRVKATATYPDGSSKTYSNANLRPWSSSDVNVATVNGNGAVTALSEGTAVISATFNGAKIECAVTVEAPPQTVPVAGLGLNPTMIQNMKVGDTRTITANVTPTTATDRTVTWSASPDNVVRLEPEVRTDADGKVVAVECKVTALRPGNAVITATTNGVKADGQALSATCPVAVVAADPSLSFDPVGPLFLEAGQTGTVKAVTTGLVKSITWTYTGKDITLSSNTGGTITITAGDKRATANISVKAEFTVYQNGKETTRTITQTYAVNVADSTSVRVDSITLNKTTATLPQGGTLALTATVSPSNAANTRVDWRSDNTDVATVDAKGVVTAKAAGEATIWAKPVYGTVQAYCTVTVTPSATGITFNTDENVYNEPTSGGGQKYTLTFRRTNRSDAVTVSTTLTPSTSQDAVLWKSEDSTVATVSGTGTSATVTRRNAGKTTITAVPVGGDGKPRPGVTPAELEVIVSGITLPTTLTLTENRRDSLELKAFGDAETDAVPEWLSTDPAIVMVDANGRLTARSKGSAVITATKSGYSATCTVTVVEDSSGIITLTGNHPAGSPVNMATASATSQVSSGTLASVLDAVCREKTKVLNSNGTYTTYGLSYVTNLSVASTDQGILHDQHHSSADTGAGVGIQEIYYPGTAPQGQRSLSDLSFVPRTTFSGTAEISYTGRSTNNQNFTGVIRVNVNGTGDVMYSSSEGSVVNFVADDFNLYHPNLRSVSFTPPLDSRGTLYYGYSSASQPGTKVTGSDTYNRTGSPSLDRVSFVPASGFEGTVSISYKGTDTAGRSFTGVVTITVTNNRGGSGAVSDIYYAAPEDGWITFRSADFSAASQYTLGEALSYVRFTLPASSEGTLFYNYRGFGSYDSAVASTTSYYYSGTPSLGGVTFVPTTTTPSQVDIEYTGYTVRGNTFTGTIHIGQNDTAQQGGLRYTVFTGKSMNFNAYDFNTACIAATGASLNYVLFSPLPAVGSGALRYTRGNSTSYSSVTTSTRCYRTSSNTWDVQLSNVSFLANNTYTGTVTIPFTGYNTNGVSFTGEVVITVTPPTTGDSVYYGTTASPLQLSSSRMRSACSGVLDGTLSYITFNSLPSTSAGRLYVGYSRIGTGTQVNTGTRYYVSGSGTPTIDQISFVPRGRYGGQVSVPYTATNTNGKSVTGIITFNITNIGSSTYFSDMGNHTWAGPAVDFLYRNNITNGVTATTFGPDQRILRCDFVLMLCRAFRFTESSGYSFADVPTNAYYANAVATAKRLGIVNGDGVNFMPNSELTRQDAMVMIKNALDAAGWNVGSASTSILGRFPDGASVASYARNAVSTLVQMGAVNGDNGMLYPYNPITRAEAAMILHFVMTM